MRGEPGRRRKYRKKNGKTNRKLEIVKEKGRGTFKIQRKSGDRLMWFTATAATVELKNFRALQQSGLTAALRCGVELQSQRN